MWKPHELLEVLYRHALNLTVPDQKRAVIGFLRLGGIDAHALVEHVDPAGWLPTFCYVAEWTYQWLDYVTRTTGRLTKSVRLIDMSNFKLSQLNKESLRRDGEAMGIMEDCYPQMLQGVFICDAPVWLQMPWRLMRPILPTRVVSKFDFISPWKNDKERERLFAYISEDNLPERFGGKSMKWPVKFSLT